MHWMQISETNSIEEMQTFRIGRWQEEKGPDDSILDYDINFVLKIELNNSCGVWIYANKYQADSLCA